MSKNKTLNKCTILGKTVYYKKQMTIDEYNGLKDDINDTLSNLKYRKEMYVELLNTNEVHSVKVIFRATKLDRFKGVQDREFEYPIFPENILLTGKGICNTILEGLNYRINYFERYLEEIKNATLID